MIKINLLKSFNAAGASEGFFSTDDEKKKNITEFAKRLVILLIGPIALYIFESQIIPDLNQQLASAQQALNETKQFNESKKGLADEIKKYEQEQAKINAQMSFVDQVAKDKVKELRLFQHLQRVTPETIWINRLQFKESELILNAETDVPADIAKFMERLSSADFLINVSPVNQDVKNDTYGLGIQMTTFTVHAQFNNAGSAP